jgi:hypothetical protein
MMMTFRRECDALIGKKASKVRRLIKVRAWHMLALVNRGSWRYSEAVQGLGEYMHLE